MTRTHVFGQAVHENRTRAAEQHVSIPFQRQAHVSGQRDTQHPRAEHRACRQAQRLTHDRGPAVGADDPRGGQGPMRRRCGKSRPARLRPRVPARGERSRHPPRLRWLRAASRRATHARMPGRGIRSDREVLSAPSRLPGTPRIPCPRCRGATSRALSRSRAVSVPQADAATRPPVAQTPWDSLRAEPHGHRLRAWASAHRLPTGPAPTMATS